MLLQDRYDQAVHRIRDNDHAAAQDLLGGIIAELKTPSSELEWAFASGAAYLHAACAEESGDNDAALAEYEAAAKDFGYHEDVRVQHWGIVAEFSRAKLLAKLGRAKEAHEILDLLTIRTMMEDHPPIRNTWNQARALQQNLQEQHGFAVGDGLEAEAERGRAAKEDTPVPYQKTESLFEKTPRIWAVSKNALTITQFDQETRIPFDQIAAIHLKFAPTKFKLTRYVLRLSVKSGGSFEIDNMDFQGVGNFKDMSIAFTVVMRLLLLHLQEAGHRVKLTSGVSWGYYALMAVLTIIATPIIVISSMAGGLIGVGLLLVVGFFAVPAMFRWFKNNRPRTMTTEQAMAFLPLLGG